MSYSNKVIVVKDDGHIDPKVWFSRYGIQYKSTKKTQDTSKDKSAANASSNPLLKIKTTEEGIRRWKLGIQQSQKQGTRGWQTLELRLYIMKHGKADGFQPKHFSDYKSIVEFYA
ncbi:hypothetical protein GF373_14830 [bacterium]|nr:hypothetical protein [bacterium]